MSNKIIESKSDEGDYKCPNCDTGKIDYRGRCDNPSCNYQDKKYPPKESR
jgi:hypothetical protein